MNYQQYRTARKLVHSCCNYEGGNCLLLDNGEECVCVQSITYSLICKWFCAAVLPLDAGLCAAYFRIHLSASGDAGSVSNCLYRPNEIRFTALVVPQIEQNGASAIGRGKGGLDCRKSSF